MIAVTPTVISALGSKDAPKQNTNNLELERLSRDEQLNFSAANICGGGGGFYLTCKDFGRMFNHSFPAFAPPPLLFFFF